jgi:predicted peptidase
VVIAMPHGHHRRVVNCSLASPEQIADMAQIISEVATRGTNIDHQRIYLCGKSMGGQEALVAAGCYPDLFAAVVAFNPIVDLAAWQQDLVAIDVDEIKEFRPDELVVEEVGGLPNEVPEAYQERSATRYADALAEVPCLIFWSEQDLIVPRQVTHHAYRLYAMIKDRSASSPIAEYNHTRIHGRLEPTIETRWQLHEWCDYELALNWLLMHRRGD